MKILIAFVSLMLSQLAYADRTAVVATTDGYHGAMGCESLGELVRCENTEVVCYIGSTGLQCHFKGITNERTAKRKTVLGAHSQSLTPRRGGTG